MHIVQRVIFDLFIYLYNNCNLENIYDGMDYSIYIYIYMCRLIFGIAREA